MAKVLIVDDDESVLYLTELVLKNAGYEVVLAKDGRECIKKVNKDRPDVILLDVMMPGEDGWEVCRKLKNDEKTKDIPVAMFTVLKGVEAKKANFDYAYADAYIAKDLTEKNLLPVVEMLLELAEGRKEEAE